MTPSALRQRVTLWRTVRVDDGAGGFGRQDTPFSLAAQIEEISVREQAAASRLEMRGAVRITVRATPGAIPEQAMRVTWSDRLGRAREGYVEAVRNPDSRQRFLELSVREGGAT